MIDASDVVLDLFPYPFEFSTSLLAHPVDPPPDDVTNANHHRQRDDDDDPTITNAEDGNNGPTTTSANGHANLTMSPPPMPTTTLVYLVTTCITHFNPFSYVVLLMENTCRSVPMNNLHPCADPCQTLVCVPGKDVYTADVLMIRVLVPPRPSTYYIAAFCKYQARLLPMQSALPRVNKCTEPLN